MTIHLQEVVRSEVEGGLAGPANPIPSQSIDCGYGQLPCPKLARFATGRLFVGLLSWVGLIQAAAYAYLHIVGPTISRRFQFDPTAMEWVLVISDSTPLVLGVLVAYWGDKIHRAAWIGGIVLMQSASYFFMIIPHLTHQTKVVEETENVTHMSIYADDSRELCSETSSRIVLKEEEPCYFTFGIIVVVQILSGVANIAYFALGISYLDDNIKKKHISAFIGVLVAVKIMGILLGCFLAWGSLRIDAVNLSPVESYREQIGAWWLGLPILTVLLIVPGLLLSWFPRMLPSQVVEQAAVSLLNNSDTYNRGLRRLASQKVGSCNFWPSLLRLITNKTLVCQILASALYVTAIVNFIGFENLIAQARFHVPKPTGTLLGFEDPDSYRLTSNILKPILIGLIVTITGLVIAKAKPTTWSLMIYGAIVVLFACAIIFSLSAAVCDKKPIVGTRKNFLVLLQHCNLNCGCSKDANFRPVCDNKGTFTFYSPCHAGCTISEIRNDITTYNGCSCVEEMTKIKGNLEAIDGPCNSSSCQVSWLTFEFGTFLAYVLVASTLVGDILVILRSVNAQDKAISIGFFMTTLALLVNILGKIIYNIVANIACLHWGTQQSFCHLHDGTKLGNYLCYLTGSLLALCVLLKILVWFFCKNTNLYTQSELEAMKSTELQELIENRTAVAKEQAKETDNGREGESNTVQMTQTQAEMTNEFLQVSSTPTSKVAQQDLEENSKGLLKYGPLGPGNRRTNSKSSLNQSISQDCKSTIRNLDSGDELSSSDEEGKKDSSPKVAYRPLDIDSDVESDLSNTEPRSRRRIMSRDYEPVYVNDQSSYARNFRREFPNPDNYGDPRLSRKNGNQSFDGSSETSSFEFSKGHQKNGVKKRGDFNEVGIPIVDPADSNLKGVKSLINRYEMNAEQQANEDQESVRSTGSGSQFEGKMIPGIPLVAMASKRLSKAQSSSGFNSLAEGKGQEDRPESRQSISTKASSKDSAGTLQTDF